MKTEYFGVYITRKSGKYDIITMNLTINNVRHSGTYKTLREAAIAVDKKLIGNGLSPVNILKPKRT
jgi:hypothetical protein